MVHGMRGVGFGNRGSVGRMFGLRWGVGRVLGPGSGGVVLCLCESGFSV